MHLPLSRLLLVLACTAFCVAAEPGGKSATPPATTPPPAADPPAADPPAETEVEQPADAARNLVRAQGLTDEGKAAMRRFADDRTRNATAIVDAAISFGKARKLLQTSNAVDKIAEVQANLFWCKKQMDVALIKDYLVRKGDEGQIGVKAMDEVVANKPEVSQSKVYFARAEAWVKANPNDQLQTAVRYLEVAELFPGTTEGTESNKRALAAQEAMVKAAAAAQEAARASRFSKKPSAESGQATVPDTATQRESLASVKKTYAADYAKREAKDKRRLVRKLMEGAASTRSDAALYYTVLTESVRLAGESEDYIHLLDACDQLAAGFKGTDATAQKKAALGRLSGKPVAVAILKLLDTPEDPVANSTVGRWFGFNAHRWEDALPMLLRANDPALAKVAQMELDHPANVTEQTLVGDAWYTLAKATSNKDDKLGMLTRSMSWYQQALPSLNAIAKDKVTGRIAEMDKQLPLDPDNVDWNALTPSQWERLKGQVVPVQAKLERTDPGITLKAGTSIRIVPHPTDTWTMGSDYYRKVCFGNGKKATDEGRSYDYYSTTDDQPYGCVLAWLDTAPVHKMAGVLNGPGRVWLGPCRLSWFSSGDGTGVIRCKIVVVDD